MFYNRKHLAGFAVSRTTGTRFTASSAESMLSLSLFLDFVSYQTLKREKQIYKHSEHTVIDHWQVVLNKDTTQAGADGGHWVLIHAA